MKDAITRGFHEGRIQVNQLFSFEDCKDFKIRNYALANIFSYSQPNIYKVELAFQKEFNENHTFKWRQSLLINEINFAEEFEFLTLAYPRGKHTKVQFLLTLQEFNSINLSELFYYENRSLKELVKMFKF